MNSCSGLGTEFFPRSSFIVRDLGSSLILPNLHAQQHGSPLGTLKLRIHERKEVRICPLLLPSLIIHFITLEKGKMHTGVRHMCSKFMASKGRTHVSKFSQDMRNVHVLTCLLLLCRREGNSD